jgi:hypothetical protein
MSDVENAYRILGLEVGASAQEVEEAYRDLRSVWQPDRFVDDPKLQEKASGKLAELEAAFGILQTDRPGETFPQEKRKEPASQGGPTEGSSQHANGTPGLTGSEGPPSGDDRMPSLFDDALAERIKKPKRLALLWPVLFALVVLGSVISYLNWSPVDVESTGESGLSESLAEGMRERDTAAALEPGISDQSDTTRETSPPEDSAESASRVVPRETSVPADQSGSRPLLERAVPPASTQAQSTRQIQAGRENDTSAKAQKVPKRTPAQGKVVDSDPMIPRSTGDREAPSEVESTGEVAESTVPSEPVVTELAGRAFQILRAKSDTANRLVEGSVSDLKYLRWETIEESSSKVFVDLIAERSSDGVQVHMVWSVDMESNSVKALSQAARDLEAGGLELK